MDKESKKIIDIFARYFFLVLIGLGNFYLIYKTLTPLTVNTVNFILSFFTNPNLIGNTISLPGGATLKIINACVAGSAFYLLLLLALTTSDIKPKIRIKMIFFSFVIFFTLNILRILILIPMIGRPYFEAVHWFFWNILSTIIVVAIWLGVIKFYKIKTIPVYSDLKYIKDLIKLPKQTKRKKKNK